MPLQARSEQQLAAFTSKAPVPDTPRVYSSRVRLKAGYDSVMRLAEASGPDSQQLQPETVVSSQVMSERKWHLRANGFRVPEMRVCVKVPGPAPAQASSSILVLQ